MSAMSAAPGLVLELGDEITGHECATCGGLYRGTLAGRRLGSPWGVRGALRSEVRRGSSSGREAWRHV